MRLIAKLVARSLSLSRNLLKDITVDDAIGLSALIAVIRRKGFPKARLISI